MKFYYTGVNKEGAVQTSPGSSLGGHVSSSALPNGSINNLFGGISQYSKDQKSKQVRAIVLKNELGAVASPQIWYDNLSSEPITNYRFAFVALAQDACGWYMETIGSEDAMPLNANFINPNTEVNKIQLPAMSIDGYIGVWVERTYNAKAINNAQSCDNLLAKFDSTNTYQVSTIQTPADVADSLDGKHFNLNTKTEDYTFWFSTGAGATAPTVVGRQLIKITLATGDAASVVATKLNNQIELLLTPRGEVETTIATDTVTVTASEYGAFPIPVDVDSGVTVVAVTAGTYNGLETVEDMQISISY